MDETAVLVPDAERLPTGEPVEVGGRVVVLADPARMLASEVDRKEWRARHGVSRQERDRQCPGRRKTRTSTNRA